MKLNKIISFIIITAMVLCMMGNLNFVSAASADITYETELLMALGITDGEEKTVTRAEFAEIIVKALNQPDSFLPADTISFTDVPKEHSKYRYVELAVSLGLMNGYSEKMFSPDKEITVKEALRVLVDALGETRVKNGMDYYAAARDDGLLHNMTGASGNPLSYEQMIILIYNFLHASVLDDYRFPDDGYKMGEGEAVLYKYFGICSLEGIYSANSYTAVDAEPTEENYVRIGGKLMNIGSGINDDYLGCNVRCYYTDEDVPTVIYTCPARKNTELVILPLDEIQDLGGALKYNSQRYSYNSKTIFIYNSEVVTSPQILQNVYSGVGSVKLVDSNYDSVYDYVFIEKYVVSTIESINLAMENFSLKGDTSATNYSDYRAAVFQKADGETIYADSLARTNVVCVAYPQTTSGALKIIKCEEGGVATIASVDSANKMIFTDENLEYKAFLNDFSVLKLGQEYNLYFDNLGIVVYVEKGQSNREMAYIMAAAAKNQFSGMLQIKLMNSNGETLFFEQSRKIKIRRPDGTFVNVKGQAVIDELQAVNPTYSFDDDKDASTPDKVVNPTIRQIIMYSLDSDNLIREIWCLSDDISLEFHSLDSLMSSWGESERSGLRYASGAKTFGGIYRFHADSLLYKVPSCEEEYDRENEEKLFYVKSAYGTLTNGSTYDTRSVRKFGDSVNGINFITAIANKENSLLADVIILETGKTPNTEFGGDTTLPILVTDIRHATDNDGYDCIKVSGYGSGGVLESYNYYDEDGSGLVAVSNPKRKTRQMAKKDVIYAPFGKGDIVNFNTGKEKNTKNTVHIYYRNDLDNDGYSDAISISNICTVQSYYSTFRFYDSSRMTTATITEYDTASGVMKVEVLNIRNRDLDSNTITTHIEALNLPGTVYYYNKNGNSLEIESGNTLKTGDTFMLVMASGSSKYAVVYR